MAVNQSIFGNRHNLKGKFKNTKKIRELIYELTVEKTLWH